MTENVLKGLQSEGFQKANITHGHIRAWLQTEILLSKVSVTNNT